jgi:hypothetical protein
LPPQKLRQLGDVGGDAAGLLVIGERLCIRVIAAAMPSGRLQSSQQASKPLQ